MPSISTLPPAPSRSDTPANFISKADALMAALAQFVTETNAVVAAMNNGTTTSVSTTSMTIAIASMSFTVEASKGFVAGQTVKIAYTTTPTNWMLGDVTSYNPATGAIVVNVLYIQGSGTYAAWTISLASPTAATMPSGSVLAFFQAAAPTGWTQITAHNNKALRIVSGAGGGSGGTVAFTTAFASQTPAGTVGNTTLTKSQIPTHVHGIGNNTNTVSGGGNTISATNNSTTILSENGAADGLGGGSHTHSFTGTAINLAVQYIDMILASKN